MEKEKQIEKRKTITFLEIYLIHELYLVVQLVKNPPAMQETLVQFLGREDLLEKQ